MCVCVCVCVCTRARVCVRVCVCTCVFVCSEREAISNDLRTLCLFIEAVSFWHHGPDVSEPQLIEFKTNDSENNSMAVNSQVGV